MESKIHIIASCRRQEWSGVFFAVLFKVQDIQEQKNIDLTEYV